MLKKPFQSKKSAIKTILTGFGFSFAFILISYMLRDDFNENGYIIVKGGLSEGQDAIFQIHSFTILGLLLLGYSIYLTIRYVNLLEKNGTELKERFTSDFHSTYVCIECGANFYKHELETFVCRRCGGNVENSKGLFDRHPNLLNIINKTKKG